MEGAVAAREQKIFASSNPRSCFNIETESELDYKLTCLKERMLFLFSPLLRWVRGMSEEWGYEKEVEHSGAAHWIIFHLFHLKGCCFQYIPQRTRPSVLGWSVAFHPGFIWIFAERKESGWSSMLGLIVVDRGRSRNNAVCMCVVEQADLHVKETG